MTESTVPNRNYTFEDVWAALMEDRQRQKEYALQQKENDRKNQEEWEKIRRSQKRLDKQMGDLHNRFGEMAEHLVAPGIVKRFNELGFHFHSYVDRGRKIMDGQGNTKAQVDVLLENGDYVIAVEVKATVREKDIEHHVRRLEIYREHMNTLHDHRKLLGAIAGAIFGDAEKEASIEAGFYVLVQSGDTMKFEIPISFQPSEW